jgi:hypothetical protein
MPAIHAGMTKISIVGERKIMNHFVVRMMFRQAE